MPHQTSPHPTSPSPAAPYLAMPDLALPGPARPRLAPPCPALPCHAYNTGSKNFESGSRNPLASCSSSVRRGFLRSCSNWKIFPCGRAASFANWRIESFFFLRLMLRYCPNLPSKSGRPMGRSFFRRKTVPFRFCFTAVAFCLRCRCFCAHAGAVLPLPTPSLRSCAVDKPVTRSLARRSLLGDFVGQPVSPVPQPIQVDEFDGLIVLLDLGAVVEYVAAAVFQK